MTTRKPKFLRLSLAVLAGLASLLVTPAASAADAKKSFDIPAGEALSALKQFAAQSGEQLLYSAEVVQGVATNAIKGSFTAREALDQMVRGTKLTVVADKQNGALSLVRATDPNAPRAAPTSDRPGETQSELGLVKLDTFEVFGSKLINIDLPRTRDDAQPYVVFDRDEIAKSQPSNLQDFLRTRLPMSSQLGTQQFVGVAPATNTVNLRGLGGNQTLFLIDGRRLPSQATVGAIATVAPDINAIPVGMIERIEVLPSTAGGIYGGSATGGVINIIMRKDYSGADLTLNYVNTFDTDTARRRVDLNASTSLRGGATIITLTASFQDANDLRVQDRDFAVRARRLAWANNPAVFTGTATPPRGYTTNIRSQNGANLVLKPQYGGATLGSFFTSVPVGYAGIASDNAAALVANAGRYNLDRANDQRSRTRIQLSSLRVTSLGLGLRQKIAPWLEGYVDYQRYVNHFSLTQSPGPVSFTLAASAPNNPFTTAVNVAYPTPFYPLRDLEGRSYGESLNTRVTGGLVAKLPAGWQAGLDYVWSSAASHSFTDNYQLGDPDGSAGPAISYTTALTTGVLDVMRDLNAQPLDAQPYFMRGPDYTTDAKAIAQSLTARASGPAFRLPTGEVVVSTSAEWRANRNPANLQPNTPSTTTVPLVPAGYFFTPEVSSEGKAAYVETRVPLLAAANGQSKQARLELQLAGRYDSSSVKTKGVSSTPLLANATDPFPVLPTVTRDFSATSYTAGLRYAPVPDLVLRASAGTGFLAPDAGQLIPGSVRSNTTTSGIVDPKRGGQLGTIGPYTWLIGSNSDLKPEHSKSYSAGVVLTPRFWPGFRFSIDYTRINKTDEISSLTTQQVLDYEDLLPAGTVVRAPLTPADQASGYKGGAITQLSTTSVNFAKTQVEAVDFQADYTRQTPFGEFHGHAVATLNTRFISQIVPSVAPLDQVGFSTGFAPLKWRGNAGVDWNRGRWSAGWNLQYYHSQWVYRYNDTPATIATTVLTQGASRYPIELFHDMYVGYQFGRRGEGWRRFFSDVKVSVGLLNVFNQEPTLQAGTLDVNGIRNIEDPRLRRYSLTFKKHF